MDSQNSESRFDTALTHIFRPRLLLQGTVEYLLAWSFTRPWWRLLLVHFPAFLLLTAVSGLVLYGALLSRSTLGERYSDWVAQELPDALRSTDENSSANPKAYSDKASLTDSADAASATESTNPLEDQQANENELVSNYGELLLRRLLQLQDSNSRITYLVAAQLSRQDRMAQARQMMRRIAPAEGGGFAPAHHWLAAEQIQHQRVRSVEDRERLIKDLSMAVRWGGCHPMLRNLYSQLLESQGNVPQAMAVLEQSLTAENSLEANLAIARLAAAHGQQGRFDRAAQAIKKEVQNRFEAGTASSMDWAYLANVLLFEKQPEKARIAAQTGLKKDPSHPQLRRLLSETFRVEYLMSIRSEGTKTTLKLGLLDAALKADPTNPAIGTEIARLLNLGEVATPELKAALEQQLAAGQATALTHILLANRQLVSGNLKAAGPHLELALRQAPNSAIVMNNLALVLSRTDQDPDRAQQLATAAVNTEPNNADFRDTLGEVRAHNGDSLGAIECYEAAIGLNPKARSTRQKLAKLYRELDMQEMAEVQERELQKPATPAPAVTSGETTQSGESAEIAPPGEAEPSGESAATEPSTVSNRSNPLEPIDLSQ